MSLNGIRIRSDLGPSHFPRFPFFCFLFSHFVSGKSKSRLEEYNSNVSKRDSDYSRSDLGPTSSIVRGAGVFPSTVARGFFLR